MNLIDSYKAEALLLENFIKEEEEKRNWKGSKGVS